MIFVLLGTQQRPFKRLLDGVDDLVDCFNITDEVIIQSGHTEYENEKHNVFNYIDEKTMLKYIEESNVIITHGGCGSIFNAILVGKKIIAVARLAKYGEMIDDHQLELIRKLSSEGYILDGSDSLIDAWKLVGSFIPRKYDFEKRIVDNLMVYLDTSRITPSIDY